MLCRLSLLAINYLNAYSLTVTCPCVCVCVCECECLFCCSAGVATLSFGFLGESVEETVVMGTKGRLTIEAPGHCPTKLTVVLKAQGRGNEGGVYEYEFELPADTDDIIKAGGYYYPNSAGFAYEAAAVARCIGAGKTEPAQYRQAETLLTMRLVDEIRSQLGVLPL